MVLPILHFIHWHKHMWFQSKDGAYVTVKCSSKCLPLTSVLVSLDDQETATTERSVNFCDVREAAKDIQAAQREEEEEDDKDLEDKTEETTEENSRGSNWEREREWRKSFKRDIRKRVFVKAVNTQECFERRNEGENPCAVVRMFECA